MGNEVQKQPVPSKDHLMYYQMRLQERYDFYKNLARLEPKMSVPIPSHAYGIGLIAVVVEGTLKYSKRFTLKTEMK